jgi:hypothetical protein
MSEFARMGSAVKSGDIPTVLEAEQVFAEQTGKHG